MKSCPFVLVFLGIDPPAHSLDWNDHFSDPQAAKTIPKLGEQTEDDSNLRPQAQPSYILTCLIFFVY
jgi:hypothetical protein